MASVNDSRLQQQPAQKDAADQNFDYMFKLLIIGNSSVGKTSFLFRYADDSFTPAFVSTVGIDFKVKTVFHNEKRIKLQIWKTWFLISSYCSVLSLLVPHALETKAVFGQADQF
uniref:small monomeric GTPase n=1 Tax=Oncorhynchus tshawytscha TaxID=74940 RepID=A0AAZ3S4W7_ONCTS